MMNFSGKKGMTTYSYITNLRAGGNSRDRLTTQTLQPSQTGPPANITIGRLSSAANITTGKPFSKVGDSSAIRPSTGVETNPRHQVQQRRLSINYDV